MSEAIRVLIADDHAMVRNGLAMFLNARTDIEVVGQAANGQEAAELSQTLQPDVVLMDLMMPEVDGITATKIIMDANPHIRVIALTSFKEDKLVYDAVKAGIVGYLLKDTSAAELATTIRDVYEGKMMISLEDMRAALRGAEITPAPNYQLSERELDVLALVVRGLSNRQIAHELTLGESTIKFHVSNILSKMGVPTRAKAVAVAVQHKLVD